MGCKFGPDPSLFSLDMHLGREPAGVLLGPFVFHTFCTCTICIYPTKITSTPNPLLGRKKSDLDSIPSLLLTVRDLGNLCELYHDSEENEKINNIVCTIVMVRVWMCSWALNCRLSLPIFQMGGLGSDSKVHTQPGHTFDLSIENRDGPGHRWVRRKHDPSTALSLCG